MRLPSMAALLLLSTALPSLAPVHAQDALEPRVGKLEKEMKAVQRKVFPGGDNRFFEAEIAPPPAANTPNGIPATTPIADLTARVGALESELTRLTGQVEQNSFKMRQLEDALTKLKGDTEFRLNTLEGKPPGGTPAGSTAAAASSVGTPTNVTAPPPPDSISAPPKPDTAATVATPPTGDPGEDAYMAGYRLWTEKKYPEAEAALKEVVAKYPKHKRASYAQNLLGRSYLDEGKPALAAEAFYANYQKMPRGERAPDSLYYLGQSLVQLKKAKEACKVYDELIDVYGATMAASLKDKVAKGRADAKCTAA